MRSTRLGTWGRYGVPQSPKPPVAALRRHGTGGNGLKGRQYVPGLMADLPVREPQRDEPRGGVSLVTQPIARLLRGRAVVAKAVGLNNQAELRPEEVDVVPVDASLRMRAIKSSAAGDR
jgi:hypothetical protein